RDLDVQIEALDAWATTPEAALVAGDAPVAAALRPFRDELAARREEARGELIDLLDARRYQDFVNDYLELTATPGAAERTTPPGSPVQVRHTAGGRIWMA